MVALFVMIMVVYGASLAVAAGSGMLWLISPSFRRFLMGDRHPL